MKPKFLIPLFILLSATVGSARQKSCEPLRIAIVDSGLDLNDPRFKDHLCKSGHKNFVDDETFKDIEGHGTAITGLVERYAGNGNYCILIYKYYSVFNSGKINTENEVRAFMAAIENGAKIINLSGGGTDFNEAESLIIKSSPEITFIVAAGNQGQNLDAPDNNFYPASLFYPNMEVVGALTKDGKRSNMSNYSKRIKNWELGENVLSANPDGKDHYLSGTSESTAIFSGKLVAKTLKTCKYR